MAKVSGKTKSGFEFSYDTGVLDDMEMLDLIADMVSGESDLKALVAVKSFSERLLGKEQKAAFYDHLRDKDGRVNPKVFDSEVVEMIGASKDAKK